MKCHFRWFAQVKIGTKKNFHNFFVWCKVAKMDEKGFFSQSLWQSIHLKRWYSFDAPARQGAIVKSRRLQFAGHCQRATNEVASSFVLWRPKPNGRRSNKLSYPDILSRDSGIAQSELDTAMQDRETWRGIVKSDFSTQVAE